MHKIRLHNASKTNNSHDFQSHNIIEKSETNYPKIIYIIFYILAAYLVLPIIDVPLLGLSISAPLFFIVAVAAVLKPPSPWFKQNQRWILFSLLIFIGVFLSTTFNGMLSSGVAIDLGGVAYLGRYAYWVIVFAVTSHLAAQKEILKKLSSIFAWSILFLSVLRWSEAMIWGNIGSISGPQILTQNFYGYQFSTFSPFLLLKVFEKRGKERFWWFLSLIVCFSAIVLNGSRGSWVSISIGLGLASLILFFGNPKRFVGLILALLILAGGIFVLGNLFPQFKSPVEQRFNTFESLEEDKSVLIRELMIQKGIRLFKDSPLFGVGAGRFSKETILLDVPKQLSYKDQSEYDTKSAHNSYVQFLAEFGLLGVIPFALLITTLLVDGVRSSYLDSRFGDVVSLAVSLSFIQMSIHLWVLSAITTTNTWFVYGLVAAVSVLHKKKAQV